MQTTIVREAVCACRHPIDCEHDCHRRGNRMAGLGQSVDFLPDRAGLTMSGCADCTPGDLLPHLEGCELSASHEVPFGSPEMS